MSAVPADGLIRTFGLTAPRRLLYPGIRHARTGIRQREVTLGDGSGAATLGVDTWTGCEKGCAGSGDHGAGRSVWLSVPCDSLPHCHSCECGSDHLLAVSDEQLAALKAALP